MWYKERNRKKNCDKKNTSSTNNFYKKISFKWYCIIIILSSHFPSLNLTYFGNENKRKIKRIINLYYNRSNNNEKENKINKKEIKKKKLVIPFIIYEKDRRKIVPSFISPYDHYKYYSKFNDFYLIKLLENGWNILCILMELNGEIVERIKRSQEIIL